MPKKAGRKPKHWINSQTGLPVVGLTRRPDGRWRIIGTHQTFREPDEQRAIARYLEMTQPLADPPSREGAHIGDILRGFAYVGGVLGGLTPEQRAYRWFGGQIRQQPKRVAELAGVEEIAYLKKIRPPEKLPTPAELGKLWTENATCSSDERRKVRKAWDHFISETGVKGIDDITPEVVVAYRDALHKSEFKGKTQAHIIGGIRRMLSFAKGRAIAVDAIARAQKYLNKDLLYPGETTVAADPHPITRAEWDKLLPTAKGDGRAMILLMLNCALYIKEVIALEWTDIESGCLLTRRKKTGKCVRAAPLWPETLAALAEVPRKRAEIFVTYQGLPLRISGGQRKFGRAAMAAKVEVTGSQLRDAAYTEAVAANIQPNLVNVFVGHKSGLEDRYVLRHPGMTRPCTDAVWRAYMAPTG